MGEWRLRSSLMALLVIATVGTFGLVGFGVLAYRVPIILEQDRQHVRTGRSIWRTISNR